MPAVTTGIFQPANPLNFEPAILSAKEADHVLLELSLGSWARSRSRTLIAARRYTIETQKKAQRGDGLTVRSPYFKRGDVVRPEKSPGGSTMIILKEALTDAQRRRIAIGHFNVSDLVGLKAVSGAAQRLSVPVLVGTSEGERNFLGVHEIVALVRSLREQLEHPIFLNVDHTHSLERAVEAARAGYDMIGFDASTMPLEKNIGLTKQAVEAAKSINPGIIVEGELGFIGSGSEIHESVPESSRLLTKTDDARCFVEATKVDVLAPAVGNMHGLLKSMIAGEVRKRLDIDRIRDLATATALPLTLHGGSGTEDGDFQRAISAGITIVHISTELRLAWRRGLEAALAENSDEVVPYKIYGKSLLAMAAVAEQRLRLFNGPPAQRAAPVSGK